MYVLQLMDSYCATYSVLLIALVESIALSWVYGESLPRIFLLIYFIGPIGWTSRVGRLYSCVNVFRLDNLHLRLQILGINL